MWHSPGKGVAVPPVAHDKAKREKGHHNEHFMISAPRHVDFLSS